MRRRAARPRRFTPATRPGRALVTFCVFFLVITISGCTEPTTPAPTPNPLPPVSVALTVSGLAAHEAIRIGVITGPKQGEGSEYRDVAEGARVGAYRFVMGGADVDIAVALDNGTVDGMAAALTQLDNQHVAGIIVASAGPHVEQALAQTPVDPPVLLPYDDTDTPAPGAWTTGPTLSMINASITTALANLNATKPYVVTEANHSGLSVAVALTSPFSSTAAQDVVDAVESGTADSLVIDASAVSQAQLAASVQQGIGGRQIPIVLTPEALTPPFAQTLIGLGPPSSTLVTVGPNTSDPAALSSDSTGAHMSAFFTALRLAANDSACLNIYGDAPFFSASSTADVASHDAVIALVRAVERAGSTTGSAVKAALGNLQVQPVDGLAGPTLDFHTPQALSPQTVQPLYASTQNPGLRPQASATLVWFPMS